MYSFSTGNIAASLVNTFGEIPPPRVGHASALVSSVLIVWGGDTKTTEGEKQDDSLYLLNLGWFFGDRYVVFELTLVLFLQVQENGLVSLLKDQHLSVAMVMLSQCVEPGFLYTAAKLMANSLMISGHSI